MLSKFQVAAVQMDITIANPAKNVDQIILRMEAAADDGAKLIVFPECAISGYCYDSLEEALPFAEPIPGPSTQRLIDVCERDQVFVVVGLLERDGDRVFNACVLLGPQGVVGKYRKMHLPFLGIDRFVTPGDLGFQVFDAGGVRIGINICYDGAFPESARVMALNGADIIVLPTNWPPGAECTAEFVINTRALENKVFYMAVDRVGTERGFTFIGKSRICDTHGTTISFADHNREAILHAELDVNEARSKKIVRIPNKHVIDRFADRRPEAYARISDAKT